MIVFEVLLILIVLALLLVVRKFVNIDLIARSKPVVRFAFLGALLTIIALVWFGSNAMLPVKCLLTYLLLNEPIRNYKALLSLKAAEQPA